MSNMRYPIDSSANILAISCSESGVWELPPLLPPLSFPLPLLLPPPLLLLPLPPSQISPPLLLCLTSQAAKANTLNAAIKAINRNLTFFILIITSEIFIVDKIKNRNRLKNRLRQIFYVLNMKSYKLKIACYAHLSL